MAGGLRLPTQALHRIHHRIRLGQEGIAHSLHPGRVLPQSGQRCREGHQ